MTDFLEHLSGQEKELIKRSRHPEWTAPMLATLTDERFSDPDWIYERKFDGERALCFRKGKQVRLLTRNRKDIGDTYPELADALSKQACADFVVDGEIVAAQGCLGRRGGLRSSHRATKNAGTNTRKRKSAATIEFASTEIRSNACKR